MWKVEYNNQTHFYDDEQLKRFINIVVINNKDVTNFRVTRL